MEDNKQIDNNIAELDTPDKRLRRHYVVGLTAVALFACLIAIIVHRAVREQELDSRVINIAGRQRMLSQKLTKIVLSIKGSTVGDDTGKHINEMREVLDLWSRSHLALQQGDAEMGLPATRDREIIDQFASIESSYQTMNRACQNIIASLPESEGRAIELTAFYKDVDLILSAEPTFLIGMNDIVYSYDENAKSKVLILKRTQWILTALILGVLAIVAFVVFEPAVRLIRHQFESLSIVAQERQQLIDELRESLAKVKQLRGLLPICASCKKIRDDEGYWTRIEIFIAEHSNAKFSHGICPDCVEQLYPDYQKREESSIHASSETDNDKQ